MPKTKFVCTMLVVCSLVAHNAMAKIPDSEATTVLHFNGKKTTVYFNDGDTFKIKDGDLKGTSVRVEGYNTLETYGPVHQWSRNSAEYLFSVANKATEHSQKGDWHCISDNRKDTYGRVLASCHDLAKSLIKLGYAHAYSVDAAKADPDYLLEQESAQKAKLGIWKYGVPEYIITSLHSADEGGKQTYNRLISTKDGHTKRWRHKNIYRECELVCVEDDNTSCMLYVPFKNRYGSGRPECLLD